MKNSVSLSRRGSSGLLGFEDRLFTKRRLHFFGFGALAATALGLILIWRMGQWVVLSDGRPNCIDFGWIWLSGTLAASGESATLFDYDSFAAAQLAFFGPHNCIQLHRFDYPPTLLFFTYLLGLMPYFVAFVAWNAGLLLFYGAAAYAVIPRPFVVIAALTPFAVGFDLKLGHNGLLTAALMGFALVLVERRPILSGVFIGLLAYKPQFGILLPFALVSSRNWRAFGIAAFAALALGVAATFAFGVDGWLSFVSALSGRNATLSPDPNVNLSLQSVYGLAQWSGLGTGTSWIVHFAVAGATVLASCWLWAKPIPLSLRAAFLCAGAVLVSPYVLAYDLCILTMAAAFLVGDGLSRGFLPGERIAVTICWAVMILAVVPIGPFLCVAIQVLAVRRVWHSPSLQEPGGFAADPMRS